MLVELFNMDPSDYKRFLNFLRKQECQVPFAAFRAVRSRDRGMPEARFAALTGGCEAARSGTESGPWSYNNRTFDSFQVRP